MSSAPIAREPGPFRPEYMIEEDAVLLVKKAPDPDVATAFRDPPPGGAHG